MFANKKTFGLAFSILLYLVTISSPAFGIRLIISYKGERTVVETTSRDRIMDLRHHIETNTGLKSYIATMCGQDLLFLDRDILINNLNIQDNQVILVTPLEAYHLPTVPRTIQSLLSPLISSIHFIIAMGASPEDVIENLNGTFSGILDEIFSQIANSGQVCQSIIDELTRQIEHEEIHNPEAAIVFRLILAQMVRIPTTVAERRFDRDGDRGGPGGAGSAGTGMDFAMRAQGAF